MMSSSSDDSDILSTFSPNTSSAIRRLRKKLRQIENLERVERELDEEEYIKLETKEELRNELQRYLNQEEKTMVTLTEQIEKTSLTYGKDVNTLQDIDGEEKISYQVSAKVIDEEDDIVDFKANGENNYIEDTKENGVGVAISDEASNINKQVSKEQDTQDSNDMTECVEKVASETNDDSVEDDKDGEAEDDEDYIPGDGEAKQQTPIQLTITKRSLRQRNRGCHKTPVADSKMTVTPDSTLVVSDGTIEDAESAKHLFSDLTMSIKMLEGHFQDVCSVDLCDNYIVSGGRDTTVKLWISSSETELKSLGGHTATVTCVKFLKDKDYASYPNAVSGSYDCSVRVWDLETGTQLKCIYAYSPVVSLDYYDGKVAIGTEGGKVEVYNVDTGDQLLSVKTHDESVSAVRLLSGDQVACGSTDGVLKIFNISIAQTEPVFAVDPLKVNIKQAEGDGQSKSSTLSMSKITCITCWNDYVIYGDEGFNIKVLDHKNSEVTKVRNNLQEFCPTESLCITSVQGNDYLFSVGADVDMGDAYINIRSLPDLKYFGTIRDSHNNTGPITSVSIEEIDSCLRLVTAGQQLRVWDQTPRRAKKRKSPSDEESLIPCKFICNYTEPRESEPESETEESSQSRASSKGESTEVATSQSWCSIL